MEKQRQFAPRSTPLESPPSYQNSTKYSSSQPSQQPTDYFEAEMGGGQETEQPANYYSEEITKSSPQSENLLQRAIKAARGMRLGAPILGMIPSSGQELTDIPKAAISSVGGTSLLKGPFGGFTMAGLGAGSELEKGLDQVGQSLQPQTGFGKDLEGTIQLASLLAPVAMNAGKIGEAGTGLASRMKGIFTEPKNIQRQMIDLEDRGPSQIMQTIEGPIHNRFVQRMGRQIGQIEGRVPIEMIEHAREGAINDFIASGSTEGASDISALENYLAEKIAGRGSGTFIDMQELQNFLYEMPNISIPLKQNFINRLLGAAEEPIQQLRRIRRIYRRYYPLRQAGKSIKSPLLRKLGGANASKPLGIQQQAELERAGRLTSRYGAPDVTGQLASLGKRYKSANLKKNLAMGGIGLGGINWLMSMIKRAVPQATQVVQQMTQ